MNLFSIPTLLIAVPEACGIGFGITALVDVSFDWVFRVAMLKYTCPAKQVVFEMSNQQVNHHHSEHWRNVSPHGEDTMEISVQKVRSAFQCQSWRNHWALFLVVCQQLNTVSCCHNLRQKRGCPYEEVTKQLVSFWEDIHGIKMAHIPQWKSNSC